MKKFKLFSYDPPKKGVEKNDERTSVQTDFPGFFIMYGRKFWNLSNLNLFVALYMLLVAFGIWQFSAMPVVFYIYLGICTLLFGLVCTAVAYISRGYVRGDPVYILSDAKYAIKHNWKQGLILGIIDVLILFLLIFDIFFWSGMDFDYLNSLPVEAQITSEQNAEIKASDNEELTVADAANNTGIEAKQPFIEGVFFYACIFLLIIYLFMRMYMYIIMVTFKLSLFKILKNSFIFAFLGIKRNLLALLGTAVVVFINMYIFVYVPIIGMVLPFIITVGTCSFISAYAAYPIIKKYMITPYYKDEEVFESYDKIFEDRG